jgi:hypothetical protein
VRTRCVALSPGAIAVFSTALTPRRMIVSSIVGQLP